MRSTASPKLSARKSARWAGIALVCATAVAGVVAQSPFDPSLERQLWKTLLPMGGDLAPAGPNFVPVPRRVSVNTPSPFRIYRWTDENGVDIFSSVTLSASMPGGTPEEQAQNAYNAEVNLLRDSSGALAGNEGACTFSHRDDWAGDAPLWRQCVTGGRMLPPPPGALLDPVGLAVDGSTVYVVDDQNQRVQAFDFEGRVRPMRYPIGNGIPGNGTYSYSSYRPYATFPGFETFDGGYSGSQLNAPNGLAVDAAHRLVIADSGNYRLAVFNNDGSPVFDVDMPEHLGRHSKPTLVAVTPGASVLAPGSAIPAGRENDRIVVTDWSQCMVHIYRPNFELVRSLPETLPEVSMHDACKEADPTEEYPLGVPTFAGEFSTVTGVAIDQAGHIYIADHAQSVVQVLDPDGNTIGWIGKPGVQAAPGELSGPVGVAIDHLGRVGVIDGGNSRVVFYSVGFSPANVLTASSFAFQLDTVVPDDDFPMGLVEQHGSAADGLDPKGRFLATDPWGRQILRFELPELGIVDPAAAALSSQPAGQPAGQVTGRGTFKVAVPRQKESDVIDVETLVDPLEPGVSVIAGSIVPGNDEVPSINIGPGEYVSYQFLYTMNENAAQATFRITARGDFDGTSYRAQAPEQHARSRGACVACDAGHEVLWLDQDESPGLAAPIANASTGEWYPAGVFVRLLPVPADGSVSHIGWHYDGAGAIFYTQHGSTQETPLGSEGFVDIPVGVSGTTTVTYWAVTTEGRMGPPHTAVINVDLAPPTSTFLIWPPYTGGGDIQGQRWYNHDVTAGYVAADAHSGTDADVQANPALADGQFGFTDEGRNQAQDIVITDRVGHAETFNSSGSSGGRPVNIDKAAPVFTQAPPDPIVVTVTGEDAQGSYATIHPDAFAVTATDPDLSNGEPGSGVWSITNPGGQVFRYGAANTWTYTVTDHAGNTRSVTVDVIVEQSVASVGVPDQFVAYGGRLILRANVTPRSARGTVTFTFGPYTQTVPVQTVSGGIDPATGVTRSQGEAVAVIDPVTSSVGVYPLSVRYAGDELNAVATNDLATVTVQARTITVVAEAKQKFYGDPDPALTFTHNPLIGSDAIAVQLIRVPGDVVGQYPIVQQSIDAGNNYSITYQGAVLTIFGRVTVTPRATTITYGDPLPVFDVDYSALPPGAVISSPPVCSVSGAQAGQHAIGCSGAAGNFVQFAYGTSTLTVYKRAATLVAGSGSKAFGAAEPALTTAQNGILAADLAGITLTTTRAPGEAVGTYATTATAMGGASGSYDFSVTPGVFTVTTARATLTVVGGTFVFDGIKHPGTCTAVGADGKPGTATTYSYNPGGSAAPKSVGVYKLTCTAPGDGNGAILSGTATIEITARPITITANAISKVYGNDDPSLKYSITGTLVAGDVITGGLTRAAGKNVGTYAISQGTLALSANYAVTFAGANLTITRRPATLTAGNAQKSSGQSDPALPAPTAAGFLMSDWFKFSSTRAAGEAVGTYAITPKAVGAALANYNVTYVNGVFTITAGNRPPVCTAAFGGEIWPPNHKFFAAPINGVTDPEGQAVTIRITGIWQDEPIDSTGDGRFAPDGQGVGSSMAWVRAERAGSGNKAKGNGRVYEILFKATDSKGASCTGSVFYTVPHDRGQRASAIDSGIRHDSTGVDRNSCDKSQVHKKSRNR